MADNEPEQADAIALVLAHLQGDKTGIEGLLATVEVRALFAAVVGLLTEWLGQVVPGGQAGMVDTLEEWLETRRASLG